MSVEDSRIAIGLSANEYSYLMQNISVYFSLVSLFLFDEFISLWSVYIPLVSLFLFGEFISLWCSKGL